MQRIIGFKYTRWVFCALLISLFLVLSGCARSFSSNGERIYFTATTSSGESISYSAGPGTMMRGRLACVNCHGPQARGGRISLMMQRFDVPNITWTNLSQDDPPFTQETLKGAITQGIDPAGGSLDTLMPRWQMSAQDLNDLTGYLMSLK